MDVLCVAGLASDGGPEQWQGFHATGDGIVVRQADDWAARLAWFQRHDDAQEGQAAIRAARQGNAGIFVLQATLLAANTALRKPMHRPIADPGRKRRSMAPAHSHCNAAP